MPAIMEPADGEQCVDFRKTLSYRHFYIVGKSGADLGVLWRYVRRLLTGVTFEPIEVARIERGPVNILAAVASIY